MRELHHSSRSGPSFRVLERQPPRPAAVLLAVVIAVSGLSALAFGMAHSRAKHLAESGSGAARYPDGTPGSQHSDKDEKDDPSQVDTIVLGDAADAPVPARKDGHVSDVHATIIVRLPRYGEQVGLIPDTPAGHLLYGWLAAFNQASDSALEKVLPDIAASSQMNLRQQTGGFSLLSAKEVQPGILVFRLHDQTPSATEVLGTLQVRPNSSPVAIASFSLRAVPTPPQKPPAGVSVATAPPR